MHHGEECGIWKEKEVRLSQGQHPDKDLDQKHHPDLEITSIGWNGSGELEQQRGAGAAAGSWSRPEPELELSQSRRRRLGRRRQCNSRR